MTLRGIVAAVPLSLLCAAATSAQAPVSTQTAGITGPPTTNTRVENRQVPKCMRRDGLLDPAHKVVPATGRLLATKLWLLTACSLGVDLNPIPRLGERRSDRTPDAGPGVAGTFDQLTVLVRPGDMVTVTDAAGNELVGRVDSVSSSALLLVANGTTRDFGEMDVAVIRQRRNDPLANGARWGLRIGAGLALLQIASCRGCEWRSIPALAALTVGVYGAMGTGIGAGIDALHRGEQTIYRRPGATVAVRF